MEERVEVLIRKQRGRLLSFGGANETPVVFTLSI